MPSDKPPPRWASELDEDAIRRAREKGPGGVTYVPPREGGSAVLYVLLTVLTGLMGFVLGFCSRFVFDLFAKLF